MSSRSIWWTVAWISAAVMASSGGASSAARCIRRSPRRFASVAPSRPSVSIKAKGSFLTRPPAGRVVPVELAPRNGPERQLSRKERTFRMSALVDCPFPYARHLPDPLICYGHTSDTGPGTNKRPGGSARGA